MKWFMIYWRKDKLGNVYLVGSGPGDPGLITVKGMELLKNCDVLIYDELASSMFLEYVQESCIKIYVGKKAGQHSKKQEKINHILITYAKQYAKVVRLKGGDPFVFGRGGEEIEALMEHNIPYEVIPGISSAIAVPECAGIPVTHRGVSQSFHVITGHTKEAENTLPDNLETLAKLNGTLVFLMGLSNLSKIIDELIRYGKSVETPAAVISQGTTKNQKIVRGTLKDIADKIIREQLTSPAVIVIGNTALLNYKDTSMKIDNGQTLTNIKIGLTGTEAMRSKLEGGLRNRGAEITTLCVMQVVRTKEIEALKEEFNQLEAYRWIVFTSQNAINLFFQAMDEEAIDRRCLYGIKFAVIGVGTKEALMKYGYQADLVPTQYTTAALARELSEVVPINEKLLIPRAARGSAVLTEVLREKGIQYKEINIYDVVGTLTDHIAYLDKLDYLVFASASGVDGFFEACNARDIRFPDHIKIACIGEITEEAVKKWNQKVEIVATESCTQGLITAMERSMLH